MTVPLLLMFLVQSPVLKLPSGAPSESELANLDFERGEEGRVPPEWSLAQASRVSGYSVELRRQGCHGGAGCAVISARPNAEKGAVGMLIQQVPAEPYQGKRMRLRAWVRVEALRKGEGIKVAFTTDGENSEETFVQKGPRVTSAEWTLAEVEGKVPWHAEQILILFSVHGKGKAWVDDVSFEEVAK